MKGWRAEQYGKRSLMWSWLLWSDREKVSYAVVYFESVIPWIDCFELDVFNVLACFHLAVFLWSEGEGFGGFLMVCLLPVYSLFWLVILMQCWNVLLRSQIVPQLHWRFNFNGWWTLAPCSRCSEIGPVQLQNESWSVRTAYLPPNVEYFVQSDRMREAFEEVKGLLAGKTSIACMGDMLTLAAFSHAIPISNSLLGAYTTEREAITTCQDR